ncbi:MAG TPA: metal-dependent hydrolase [Candidatus Ozemobacteraceae bacterium]|nr:metal-dependent hydrolase [Candidatus Ozemobacteraceae bacterium]
MNIITHGLVSWCVAQPLCRTRRDTALAASAGLLPDLDGIGALADLARGGEAVWFSAWHHTLGHNLAAGALTIAILTAFAARRLRVAATAAFLFALHLLCDLVGSRGPDGETWPIPWLYPFRSDLTLSWSGQWEINAWQNISITIIILILFFRQVRDVGFSPLGLVSERADAAFVAALRARFPLAE